MGSVIKLQAHAGVMFPKVKIAISQLKLKILESLTHLLLAHASNSSRIFGFDKFVHIFLNLSTGRIFWKTFRAA